MGTEIQIKHKKNCRRKSWPWECDTAAIWDLTKPGERSEDEFVDVKEESGYEERVRMSQRKWRHEELHIKGILRDGSQHEKCKG